MRKRISTLAVTAVSVLALGTVAATSAGAADPPVLETLEGTLERVGDEYFVGDTEVDFGPIWYLTDARAKHDYDGDGRLATLAAEVGGLVGTIVALEVEFGQNDADVFTVNGMPYRDASGNPPPWAGGPGDGRTSRLPRGSTAPETAGDGGGRRRPPSWVPGPPPWCGPPSWVPGPPPGAGTSR